LRIELCRHTSLTLRVKPTFRCPIVTQLDMMQIRALYKNAVKIIKRCKVCTIQFLVSYDDKS